MRRLTASSIHRAMHCTAWLRDDYEHHYSSSPASAVGSAVHLLAERWNLGVEIDAGVLAAELAGLSPAHRDEALSYWAELESWLETNFDGRMGRSPEISFAYLPGADRAQVVVRDHPRDYSRVPAGWMSGTADLVCYQDGHVTVYDWKTGHGVYLEPIWRSSQLRFLALCAARAYGATSATVAYVRLRPAQDVEVEESELDEFELDVVAAEIAAVFGRIRPDAEPEPGEHCRWCPASGACPAMGDVLVGAAPVAAPVRLVGAIESHAEAERRLALLPALQQAVEAYHDRLKTWANQHGGIASNGGTWRSYTSERETLHPTDEALALLESRLLHHFNSAISTDISKASVTRGAKAAGIAHKELLDDLRALGAFTRDSFTVWRVGKSKGAET